MENNNKNDRLRRFVYTDEDMPGIIIIKKTNPMSPIINLLKDISGNRHSNLDKAFNNVAEILIQCSKLIAGDSEYQIKEVELYFASDYYNHSDPFVHSIQYNNVGRQYEFGEWYFHRFTSSDRYNHKLRGLDLTFGDKHFGNSGGILIRGIKSLSNGRIFQGPSNVVGEIKSQLEKSAHRITLNNLAKELGGYAFNPDSPLKIEANDFTLNDTLRIKRFGLAEKNNDIDNIFFNKEYRYVDKDFDYLAKLKDKYKIVKQLYNSQLKMEEVIKILNYRPKFLAE